MHQLEVYQYYTKLQIRYFSNQKVLRFFLFLHENISCATHKIHLTEALVMSTTTYVFVEKCEKYYVEIPSYLELCYTSIFNIR